LPIRIIVLSSSQTIEARTRSRGSSCLRRSLSIRSRIFGNARAKSAKLEYFTSSRLSDQRV
jgi:hypothetical protein